MQTFHAKCKLGVYTFRSILNHTPELCSPTEVFKGDLKSKQLMTHDNFQVSSKNVYGDFIDEALPRLINSDFFKSGASTNKIFSPAIFNQCAVP